MAADEGCAGAYASPRLRRTGITSLKRLGEKLLDCTAPHDRIISTKANAIVKGKVISFNLLRGMVAAHRRNKGRSLDEAEAVEYVESKRRVHAKKRMSAYIESGR